MKPSELLSRPGAWCQSHLAKDENGDPCFTGSVNAVQWCIVGAIEKCRAPSWAFTELEKGTGGFDIVDWNNAPNRTQSEVVALLQSVGL